MKGIKQNSHIIIIYIWFESLVSYERYQTADLVKKAGVRFESLVSYERYQTKVFASPEVLEFESLVSYERYQTLWSVYRL